MSELDKAKFSLAINKHKEHLAKVFKKHKDKPKPDEECHQLIRLKKEAKELSLAYSMLKCDKCGSEERLSWHHLVYSIAKDYMPFDRYVGARYYWNNIIILCWVCHKKYHGINNSQKTEHETEIPEKWKERIRKKFYIQKGSSAGENTVSNGRTTGSIPVPSVSFVKTGQGVKDD